MNSIVLRRSLASTLLAAALWLGGGPFGALIGGPFGGIGSAMAEGDAAAGGVKAYTCLGCHGVQHYVNSYPTYHVPRIAGQNADYLIAALKAYRSKERSHQTMQSNANLLSDQDIEDIAAWFAAQGRAAP